MEGHNQLGQPAHPTVITGSPPVVLSPTVNTDPAPDNTDSGVFVHPDSALKFLPPPVKIKSEPDDFELDPSTFIDQLAADRC